MNTATRGRGFCISHRTIVGPIQRKRSAPISLPPEGLLLCLRIERAFCMLLADAGGVPEDRMTQTAFRSPIRSIQPAPASSTKLHVRGTMPVAQIDWRSRRARCAAPECGVVITRLVRIGRTAILRPIFSGEWHEADDHVWRVTSYARATRQRGARQGSDAPSTGRALGLSRRRLWSDPTTWQPVIAATPCVVECSRCRTIQAIQLG